MQSAKDVTREILNSLPDDCTLDDISYRLYLWRKMEMSAKDIDEGRVYSTDQAREIIQSWRTTKEAI